MKQCIDLNSDMGEGFGPWRIGDGIDEQIMPLISSANIATGFHAGDPGTMHRTVALAKVHGVGVGAHPGLRDLVGFGRRHIDIPAPELVNDIIYQLGALREFARLAGLHLQHIKPHGALYMHPARDEALARPVVREFYADRAYAATGSIVFTRRPGRLDPRPVADKVVRACVEGRVRTVQGGDIAIGFDSVCIHSDTPGALELLQALRQALADNAIRVAALPEVLQTA